MIKETGGTAFPARVALDNERGMTLRDYFAAKAMQVLLANEETSMGEDARDAYMVADAMLKARGQ